MGERPEYRCETIGDSDNVERVAAHFGLDSAALEIAHATQGAFSVMGLGRCIAVYTDALGDQGPNNPPSEEA